VDRIKICDGKPDCIDYADERDCGKDDKNAGINNMAYQTTTNQLIYNLQSKNGLRRSTVYQLFGDVT
jgi:hypothetical protein